jgi:hypothetical protein
VRHLSEDELRDIGEAVGAGAAGDLTDAVRYDGSDLVSALVWTTASIVVAPPFERRNHAVAISAAATLARLNGRDLDLEPAEDVVALVASVAAGEAHELFAWFEARLGPMRAVAAPACPGCSMPLRECLRAVIAGRVITPHCGGCGRLLARPARDPRQLQEA